MSKYGWNEEAGSMPNYQRFQGQIFAEQVDQLFRLAPYGMFAAVVNALLVFLVLKNVMRLSYLTAWLALVILLTGLRLLLTFSYLKSSRHPAEAKRWANRFLAGLVVAGLCWGGIGVLPFDDGVLAYEVFIAFVLGGMAAGASTTFATVKHAYPAFALPTLLPLTVHFIAINDTFHLVMATMVLVFCLLLWRISLHNYALNTSSLLLKYENREVIETLEQSKVRVEHLNTQLVAEIQARRDAEEELRAQQELLEHEVAERTAALRQSNELLLSEIEERKQYEVALLETGKHLAIAQSNAEAANRAKTEFLANMSHEMRTPLAGALGMMKLVLDMDIGAEERTLLDMAKRSADSLVRIISDVLDFARLEAGMMTFEQKPFSLQGVVKSALEVVCLVAEEKRLKLTWDVDGSLPDAMVGDQGRLRQVLVNLLGNALKFTEQGAIELKVMPADPKDEEGMILFSVRDTGIGIPSDQLERIFGRFTQVDSSLTRQHGGTGLGLALTRQIVEKLGGRIWAESREGAGSTFYFTIPWYRGADGRSAHDITPS
ncbi:sensor histidine kinase [Geomonas propionica]|uniref:histidine kinase n=1 Tax=Geomonas propionica TaxID=2798582 RepID=A0ABS0YNE6_9BACT|nr:ATP-binding protein [Geomonas propionica]MBJ6799277.1 histidine kinase [Geomonas propionica]